MKNDIRGLDNGPIKKKSRLRRFCRNLSPLHPRRSRWHSRRCTGGDISFDGDRAPRQGATPPRLAMFVLKIAVGHGICQLRAAESPDGQVAAYFTSVKFSSDFRRQFDRPWQTPRQDKNKYTTVTTSRRQGPQIVVPRLDDGATEI